MRRGDIIGIKVCKDTPTLTHLLFVDDCFLFCRSNAIEASILKDILDTYDRASGQLINFQKSEVFFSSNTPHTTRQFIYSLLGVTKTIGIRKYLGLPSIIGRRKKEIFCFIKDRLWKRISHWTSKNLSKAGKEIMIKSMAQSILPFCMSIFLLPTSLEDELQKMMNSFWWGSNSHSKKDINWLNWDKLTMIKDYGGMSFRHLHAFNIAMLGKQGWGLITNQNTMVSQAVKAK